MAGLTGGVCGGAGEAPRRWTGARPATMKGRGQAPPPRRDGLHILPPPSLKLNNWASQ